MDQSEATIQPADIAKLRSAAELMIDRSIYRRLYEEITYLERYRDEFFRQKIKLSSAE